MPESVPQLSRFELQCLSLLWRRGEASIRQIHADIRDAPTYSTVRKIFERLEQKRAIKRVRLDGRAWVYRSAVSPPTLIRKEIRRLIDGLFGGLGKPLVAHLADMDEIGIEDLREIESRLREEPRSRPRRRGRRGKGA